MMKGQRDGQNNWTLEKQEIKRKYVFGWKGIESGSRTTRQESSGRDQLGIKGGSLEGGTGVALSHGRVTGREE